MLKNGLSIFLFLYFLGNITSCGNTSGSTASVINVYKAYAFSERPFPDDNVWNQDISNDPVDPNSDTYINSLGPAGFVAPDFGTVWDGSPIGIPFVVVSGNQPKVPVTFEYADYSDAGPYPIPTVARIQGGANSSGDRHMIVVDN